MAFGQQVTCTHCGQNFTKGTTHKCLLEDYIAYAAKRLERRLKNEDLPLLTPRQRKTLKFYEWCRENGRD